MNKNSILKLDNKLFNFLGEISYGIYMYHMIIIFTVVMIIPKLNVFGNTLGLFVFYILISGLVILTAYLSKRYFEDYFLKMKKIFN